MAATIAEVRNLMDAVSATQLADDVLTAHLTRSNNWVANIADADASTTDVDNAVRAVCVWFAYGSYTEGMSRQIGAVPETAQWKLRHYKTVANLFLNDISKSAINLNEDLSKAIGLPPQVGLPDSEGYKQT